MRRLLFLFALLAALGATHCLGEWGIDEKEWACRKPSDCVEGYFCHPISYVCVVTGTSTKTPVGMMSTDAG